MSPEIKEKVNTEIANQERDYTAERNSRVLPLVKDTLYTIGTYLFNFNRDLTPEAANKERESLLTYVRTVFMPNAIGRSLRFNEIDYHFQLTGAVIQMLKSRANTPADEKDERLSKAAQEILARVGAANTLMIDFSADNDESGLKRAELYDTFYTDIVVPVFEQFEIKSNESAQVFAIIDSLLAGVRETIQAELVSARKVAEAKMWEVDDIDNLDILTIHKKVVEPSTEGVY